MLEMTERRDAEAMTVDNDGRDAVFAFAADTGFLALEPQTLKVLVIEDDPADFALIERCLRHMVFREPLITLAGNAVAGRLAAAADAFDVVLLDYSLDGGSGADLIPQISAGLQGIPCILVTSDLTDEVECEAMEMGAVACLVKDDLTPRVLETVIRQSMRTHEMERALQSLGHNVEPFMPALISALQSQNWVASRVTTSE